MLTLVQWWPAVSSWLGYAHGKGQERIGIGADWLATGELASLLSSCRAVAVIRGCKGVPRSADADAQIAWA